MGSPITIDEITKTEDSLGVIFLQAFKEKMVKDNGGSFSTHEDAWELIPFKNRVNSKTFSQTCNDLIYELKSARQWDSFPENLYPFAQNSCGDYLVFSKDQNVSNRLMETVYFWSHDEGDIWKEFSSFEDIQFD